MKGLPTSRAIFVTLTKLSMMLSRKDSLIDLMVSTSHYQNVLQWMKCNLNFTSYVSPPLQCKEKSYCLFQYLNENNHLTLGIREQIPFRQELFVSNISASTERMAISFSSSILLIFVTYVIYPASLVPFCS